MGFRHLRQVLERAHRVRHVGIKQLAERRKRHRQRGWRTQPDRYRDHHLAEVCAAREEPERVSCLALDAEAAEREPVDHNRLEPPREDLQHLCRVPVRVGGDIERHVEDGIGARHGGGGSRKAPHRALPDLFEPAGRRKECEGGGDEVRGQAVEHAVQALPAKLRCERMPARGSLARARRRAHVAAPQEVVLARGARGAKEPEAKPRGVL
mmetsp:Transcript_3832/g.12246  ORF Transcript_3832/g.12246 Transcript_3832/m.12246 type:complete len:210 (+) Transcript_3832:3616-4245(+)